MNILFLGDSLIEYFDWQERFPGHNVANHGFAGESVGGLLSRLVKVNQGFPAADMVLIMTGINNLAMDDLEIVDIYKVVLEKLAAFYPGVAIFVHSLLPVAVPFLSNDTIKQINVSLRELAREHGAEYVDLYSRFVDTKGDTIKEYLLDDGVHLSRAGYDVWGRVVEEIINQKGRLQFRVP